MLYEMKAILISLLFVSSAIAGALDAPVGRVTIGGIVVQRTADGLLVQTRAKGDAGQIWIRGYDAKEGASITLACKRAGTFSFESVGRGSRTLDCYEPFKQ